MDTYTEPKMQQIIEEMKKNVNKIGYMATMYYVVKFFLNIT